jgi:formylglycine-generating enzyme required for sulfatase activity
MVEIPGGSFTMGSPNSDHEREGPQHTVSVPAFYMGKYEVTLDQWGAVAKLPKINRDLLPPDVPRTRSDVAEPSFFKGSKLPVHKVFWGEAVEFCERLSRATGRTYRLPSEAEWEYACRAGTTTPFAFGETITTEIANYDGEQPYGSAPKGMNRQRTTPVGFFRVANGFGLYDMHGNASEWCLDTWHWGYDGAPKDGSARKDKARFSTDGWVRRGGRWCESADESRSAYRGTSHMDLSGFRVVCVASIR